MRQLWTGPLIGLFLQFVLGCMNESRAATSTNSLLPIEIVLVSTTNIMSTQVGYDRKTPPPWTNGNTMGFTFKRQTNNAEELVRWRVINMHTENFVEITGRLKLDTVEVAVVHDPPQWITEQPAGKPPQLILHDTGSAVIIDRRIPKKWFSASRASRSNPAALRLEQAFPDKFWK
jgi:hypothetical protein